MDASTLEIRAKPDASGDQKQNHMIQKLLWRAGDGMSLKAHYTRATAAPVHGPRQQ